MQRFEMTDIAAWKLSQDARGSALELHAASDYAPPHRSPLNIALIRGLEFRSFLLDVDVMQTGREYGHRDLCFFFGFQDSSHFYYVHIATNADPNAHNVFIVNNAPRQSFAAHTTSGVTWGTDQWHHVRIVRDVDAGTIRLYFDDMNEPIMKASDQTFTWGHIGLGSFDDVGRFDNVRIESAECRPSSFKFSGH